MKKRQRSKLTCRQQTDKKTDRPIDKNTRRQTYSHTERQKDARRTNGSHINRQMEEEKYRPTFYVYQTTDKKVNRRTNRWKDIQAKKQEGSLTDEQTYRRLNRQMDR